MTLEPTFEMEQKPVELKFFSRHLKEVQQYLGNQTERTQSQIKRLKAFAGLCHH